MAGEFTDAEQKIYDEFEAGGRAVLDKAKAEAAAIGVDLKKIVGPFEAEAVKVADAVASEVKKDAGVGWRFLSSLLQFLDGPNGKFSHKRLEAVIAFGIGVRQFVIGDQWGAAGFGAFSLVMGVISALTKT